MQQQEYLTAGRLNNYPFNCLNGMEWETRICVIPAALFSHPSVALHKRSLWMVKHCIQVTLVWTSKYTHINLHIISRKQCETKWRLFFSSTFTCILFYNTSMLIKGCPNMVCSEYTIFQQLLKYMQNKDKANNGKETWSSVRGKKTTKTRKVRRWFLFCMLSWFDFLTDHSE